MRQQEVDKFILAIREVGRKYLKDQSSYLYNCLFSPLFYPTQPRVARQLTELGIDRSRHDYVRDDYRDIYLIMSKLDTIFTNSCLSLKENGDSLDIEGKLRKVLMITPFLSEYTLSTFTERKNLKEALAEVTRIMATELGLAPLIMHRIGGFTHSFVPRT